jgi:23S rRNA (pseudouridine1915-N3)-methyltransferase
MARELVVAWFGRRRRDAWDTLADDYLERIRRVWPCREVVLRPAEGDGPTRLKREAELLRAALPTPATTIALDRRGKSLGSRELAERLIARLEASPNPVWFVIGSDLGLDPTLVAASDERWSLGPLTLPHALARVVLLEQLYRASSLASGSGYHRDPL